MKIPIFVSAPSKLNSDQEKSLDLVREELDRFQFEERRLGASDYPVLLPLREVLTVARHCSGGIILGFVQFKAEKVIIKPGTEDPGKRPRIAKGKVFPTPWNNLEAGVLFGLTLPLLVFREEGVEGGIFDAGVSDVFVHPMPLPSDPPNKRAAFQMVFLKWQAEVRNHYYR